MSFIKIVQAIFGIFSFVMEIPVLIEKLIKWRVDGEAEKRTEEVKKGVDAAKAAKTVEESANAACKIEKALDPDSHCDDKPGYQ